MDSRAVARDIKNEIWPRLRREGFTEFSPKTAWRHTPDQIHVVNYQSFNSYLAERVGCTTFSFALNLGIFFRAIPFEYPVKKGPDPSVKPQEYHCHFRHRLLKEISQPILPRRDTWYVEPDGSNLLECLDDSRMAIERDGLPWFDRFKSLEGGPDPASSRDNAPSFALKRGPKEAGSVQARRHRRGTAWRTYVGDRVVRCQERQLPLHKA